MDKETLILSESSELDRAAVVFNVQDIADKLQDIAEDVTKMQTNAMLITDKMRTEFGTHAADRFEKAIVAVIGDTVGAIRTAKDAITTQVDLLQGRISDEDIKTPSNDMSLEDDNGEQDAEVDDAEELNNIAPITEPAENNQQTIPDDAFSGDESAAGPTDEPLGRAKRENAQRLEQQLVETYAQFPADVILTKYTVKVGYRHADRLDEHKFTTDLMAPEFKGKPSITESVKSKNIRQYSFPTAIHASRFIKALNEQASDLVAEIGDVETVVTPMLSEETKDKEAAMLAYIKSRMGTVSPDKLCESVAALRHAMDVSPSKAIEWVENKIECVEATVNRYDFKYLTEEQTTSILQAKTDVEKQQAAKIAIAEAYAPYQSKDFAIFLTSDMVANDLDQWAMLNQCGD